MEKVFILQGGRLDTEQNNVVYICRPKMIYMKYIAGLFLLLFLFSQSSPNVFLSFADQIHIHKREGTKRDYHVFFVPRRTMICEKILEEEGVYGG